MYSYKNTYSTASITYVFQPQHWDAPIIWVSAASSASFSCNNTFQFFQNRLGIMIVRFLNSDE